MMVKGRGNKGFPYVVEMREDGERVGGDFHPSPPTTIPLIGKIEKSMFL